MYYTYAYLRKNKTPYYIGKGSNNRIFKRKKKDVKPPKDKSRIIFLKQNLTEEEAFKHEKYMIAVFGRKDLGTGILHNKTDGGEGTLGVVITPQFREKMRNIMIGRTHTKEAKLKISKANKGKSSWIKGKNHSEKTKFKLSEANKNKIVSEETKEKISKSQTKTGNSFYGKKHTEESKRKMSKNHADVSGDNNPFMGKKHSEEAKEKMRKAWIKRKELKSKTV